MFNKRRFFLVNKFNILILLCVIIFYFLPITFSKYESDSSSGAVSSIAYYVVNPNYNTYDVKLTGLIPSDVSYVYSFTVSNFDDEGNVLETDLYYDLSVVTTTNLPLEYNLVMSNDGSVGTNSIIINDEVISDDDGTYFRTLSTDRIYMSYREAVTYTYTLYINFDSSYDSFIYQDIIDGIRIIIDSKQVIDGE